MKNFQKPLHTHFIGVPITAELEELVAECRDYMNAAYGCKSGYGTPPHITLIAPFKLPRDSGWSEQCVFNLAADCLKECAAQKIIPFNAKIQGFGAFAERTLFAHVCDGENWQKMHSVFAGAFGKIPGAIKKPERKFYPHLSVANRDIPYGAMDAALKHFAELNLCSEFCVQEICVYVRNSRGGWTEGARILP